MKKILILNGSFCEQPLIVKAKEMGFHVTTTGNMPELMGHAYADEYIPADYSDKEAVLRLVQEHHIEGIVSCANDFGVITAAYVAEKMGWPGHDTYENAVLLHHKDKFKKYCYDHKIPSPHSVAFDNEANCMAYVQGCDFPMIVKASDLTGGKGIMRADTLSQAQKAVKNAFQKSRAKHVVVEPFIEGTQHTIDAFIVDRKVAIFTSCNCYSPINPYLIQSETLPATGIENVQEELCGIIENMAQDLKLVDGILALQYMMKDGKPYIIEMMRRCFGNQFLTLMDAITGFPWEEAYIRAALGLDCHNLVRQEPTVKYCGHHGIMATRNGTLESYHIPASIQSHLFKKIDIIRPGEAVTDYMNQRISYLYYAYDDQKEMNAATKTFNRQIQIDFQKTAT